MQRGREGFGPTSAKGGPAWTGRRKDDSGSQLAPFLELAGCSEGRRGTGDTSRGEGGGGNPGGQEQGSHSWHPVCTIKMTRRGGGGKGLPQHRDPDKGHSAATSANAAPLLSQKKETVRQDTADSTAATRMTRSLT